MITRYKPRAHARVMRSITRAAAKPPLTRPEGARLVLQDAFPPLPPHEGRQVLFLGNRYNCHISIHSLRMEGDCLRNEDCFRTPPFQSTPSAWRETAIISLYLPPSTNFNPLPPHGGRLDLARHELSRVIFQSTPSAWRETCSI